MRIMGLDYGTKTVGVAVSDDRLLIAQPFETITRDNPRQLRKTLQRIEAIIAEKEVGEIALGLPLNMDDTEGERAAATREFQAMLERRTLLPVHMVDERLTTVEADQILAEMEVPRSERKAYIDKIAAAIILQSFLDARSKE
ncbi:MAG: Holliday junction resolvase RuvX [Eubacterium sp.]|nr:Holliday junction resolvase RuvX [Eubacterium sp.]